MRPSNDEFDDLAFDEIESMRRRAHNRKIAQMRTNSRNHYGLGDDEDDAFDESKWTVMDDYDENEWNNYSS